MFIDYSVFRSSTPHENASYIIQRFCSNEEQNRSIINIFPRPE